MTKHNIAIIVTTIIGALCFPISIKTQNSFLFIIATIDIIILVILIKRNGEPKYRTENNEIKQETKNYLDDANYSKKRLLTFKEIEYKKVIEKHIPEKYIFLPQICLASVINKNNKMQYAAELFRIIDFGIFDENYNLIVLIEINDNSHLNAKRVARDHKVKMLCERSKIKLITFWTEYGINEQQIKETLGKILL